MLGFFLNQVYIKYQGFLKILSMFLLNCVTTLALLQENSSSVHTNQPTFQLKRNLDAIENAGMRMNQGLSRSCWIDTLIHLPKGPQVLHLKNEKKIISVGLKTVSF